MLAQARLVVGRAARGITVVGLDQTTPASIPAFGRPDQEPAAFFGIQQTGEDWLGIEARQAAPHHLSAPMYQCGKLAVPD